MFGIILKVRLVKWSQLLQIKLTLQKLRSWHHQESIYWWICSQFMQIKYDVILLVSRFSIRRRWRIWGGSRCCWRGIWSIWSDITTPKTSRTRIKPPFTSSRPLTPSREAVSCHCPSLGQSEPCFRSWRREESWCVSLHFRLLHKCSELFSVCVCVSVWHARAQRAASRSGAALQLLHWCSPLHQRSGISSERRRSLALTLRSYWCTAGLGVFIGCCFSEKLLVNMMSLCSLLTSQFYMWMLPINIFLLFWVISKDFVLKYLM